MGRENVRSVPPSDKMDYEYGKATINKSRERRRTNHNTAVVDSERVQKPESVSRTEDEAAEDIGEIDASEMNELVEFMESDTSIDSIIYRLEEDEDSKEVQRLTAPPKRIVRETEKKRVSSIRASASIETEEEVRPRSRWLITSCYSCGILFNFLADEPHPFTCGRPQCIEKFEQRKKSKPS